MEKELSLTVSSESVGLRLDEYLAKSGSYLSRSKASAAIKRGEVKVNGKIEKAHYPLEEGDLVTYLEPTPEPSFQKPENIPLSIVYEDDDIIIVDKPVGLVVHPGNGHHDGTLVNALLYHQSDISGGSDPTRPGIVHRIDKDTSGLLAIAKNDFSFAGLQAQLSDHSMSRKYYALALGVILEDDGKIIAPIGKDKTRPNRNCVDLKNGKEAITYFHVEKRFKTSDVSFISCRLLTGRTHQIRVHLDYIGHPIIGDPLYGKGNRKIYDQGQLLHAYELTLVHPRTQEKLTFSSPLPEHFKKVLEELK